jgi:hypothetical protein
VSELRKLAHSYNASVLQNFALETSHTTKRLVKNWWNAHSLPYCMRKIKENRVSFVIYCLWVSLYAARLTCLFFFSLKLTKALEATASTRALKRVEMVCG